ncbi:MAG: F0F1 ATP synthase subunit A [Oscillospiraceae bacterium]|nr:F0F1 ATP synthase subunit A [Oscillospiraceae bacterium]
MNVNVTGPYIYYTIPIFGGIPITQTTVSLLVVTILLCTAFILLGRNLKKRPDGKQVLVEKGVSMLYNMVVGTMGEHNAHFVPLIGTIFLSSICGSLIGMTGFLRSTTADLSVVLVWSVMVTLIIWYNNIKHNGFLGWLKGFTEPIFIMTPMNLLSEFAQPVAMAFRHFGNVAGGGVITSILYTALGMASAVVLNLIASSPLAVGIILAAAGVGMIFVGRLPMLKTWKYKAAFLVFGVLCIALGVLGLLQHLGILSDVPVLMLGIPAMLSLYFDLFSGFVQALVFSMLTMVYVAGACPPPEET